MTEIIIVIVGTVMIVVIMIIADIEEAKTGIKTLQGIGKATSPEITNKTVPPTVVGEEVEGVDLEGTPIRDVKALWERVLQI